jgi:hypothetical protein
VLLRARRSSGSRTSVHDAFSVCDIQTVKAVDDEMQPWSITAANSRCGASCSFLRSASVRPDARSAVFASMRVSRTCHQILAGGMWIAGLECERDIGRSVRFGQHVGQVWFWRIGPVADVSLWTGARSWKPPASPEG